MQLVRRTLLPGLSSPFSEPPKKSIRCQVQGVAGRQGKAALCCVGSAISRGFLLQGHRAWLQQEDSPTPPARHSFQWSSVESALVRKEATAPPHLSSQTPLKVNGFALGN